MTADLMPPNATVLERGMSETISETLTVTFQGSTLWNPATCPEQFLSLLAYQLQVTEWNPAWSVDTRRQVCQAATGIHKRRGTVGAVRDALGAVGISATLTEWFNAVPPAAPHTFTITVSVNDNIDALGQPDLPPAEIDRLFQMIDSAKRLSQHYDVQFDVTFTAPLGLGAILYTIQTVDIEGTATNA